MNEKKTYVKINKIKWCKLFEKEMERKYAPWRVAAFSGMFNCSQCMERNVCSKWKRRCQQNHLIVKMAFEKRKQRLLLLDPFCRGHDENSALFNRKQEKKKQSKIKWTQANERRRKSTTMVATKKIKIHLEYCLSTSILHYTIFFAYLFAWFCKCCPV